MEITQNGGRLELRHSSNPALEDLSSSLQSTFEELVKGTDDYIWSRQELSAEMSGSTVESGGGSFAAKTAEDLNNWLIGGRNDPLIEQNRDDVEQLVQAILSSSSGNTPPQQREPSVAVATSGAFSHLLPPSPCPSLASGHLEPFLCELRHYLDEAACALMSSPSSAMQKHVVPTINRWRNIDLDLPVLVPHSTLKLQYEKKSALLCASSAAVSVRYTFARTDDPLRHVADPKMIAAMFASEIPGSEPAIVPSHLLCTRLAVLHKVPDFLLPMLAKALFVAIASSAAPYALAQPIDLLCSKVSKCSIALRGPSNAEGVDGFRWTERVEALMEPASQCDERRLAHLSQILSVFAYTVNEPINALVAEWFHTVTTNYAAAQFHPSASPNLMAAPGLVPRELYDPHTQQLGLVFKWAPSRQMKVLLGSRSALTSSSLSSKRIDSKGFQASEIRLQHERRNEKQWDPTLLKYGYKVPAKKLLQTPEGIEARVELCANAALPNIKIQYDDDEASDDSN